MKVDAEGQAELERRAEGGELEARGHLRARARLLPLAVHRGSERDAARVHGRRARGRRDRRAAAQPMPTRRSSAGWPATTPATTRTGELPSLTGRAPTRSGGPVGDGDVASSVPGSTTPRSRPGGCVEQEGKVVAVSVSIEVSAACTVTFIAADGPTVAVADGAAIDRMPTESSSSDSAHPRSRISARISSSSARDRRDARDDARPRRGGRARRRARRGARSASSTWPIDVASAGNGCRSRPTRAMIFGTGTRAVYTMSLPSSCDIELDSPVWPTRATQMRPGDVPDALRGDAGRAQSQHLGGQRERAADRAHVPELLERHQQASRRRPGETGPAGHLADA